MAMGWRPAGASLIDARFARTVVEGGISSYAKATADKSADKANPALNLVQPHLGEVVDGTVGRPIRWVLV